MNTRPVKQNTMVRYRCEKSLLHAFDQYAAKRKTTRSQLIRALMKHCVKEPSA